MPKRAEIGLQSLDLNLLVAFDALASEASVTRAARRLGVTQSAMSHTLRRLRELLGDPLLVRVGGSMQLTPRAEALAMPIRGGLNAIERALNQAPQFEPATSTREFRIAGPDLVELLFLPRLLKRIAALAPGVRLVMLRLPAGGSAEPLQSGELDVAIEARSLGGSSEDEASMPQGVMRRSLLHDTWSCFARVGHPELTGKKRLTLARFLKLSHAMVSPTGRGPGIVDQVLAGMGHTRTVGLRVPHFYSAPVAVAASDLLFTAPSALAKTLGHITLQRFKPPIDLPGHSVDARWHTRLHADAGHKWLREQLAAVGNEVMPSASRSR